MAAKRAQIVVQALGLMFTSLVAPVVVNVLVHDLNAEDAAPPRREQPPSHKEELPHRPTAPATSSPSAPAVQSASPKQQSTPATTPPAPVLQVIVQGTGRSPEEALQQALRNALYTALAAQCDAETWARCGHDVFEDVWRNGAGIIRGWKKLSTTKEWKLGGSVYHAEVTMEIDRQALLARLDPAPAALAGSPDAASRNSRGWACKLVK